MDRLRGILRRIDGRGYKAYKDIRGGYEFPNFTLLIDHVQGDPFAAPSRLRVRVKAETARLPEDLWEDPVRRVALEDFLARRFSHAIARVCRGRRGSGKSGMIAIDTPRQEILERTAMAVNKGEVETRFVAGLPAAGRRVLAREAETVLFQEIPRIVEESLFSSALDMERLQQHVRTAERQEWIRQALEPAGLVGFLEESSILPRASGVSDRPLSPDRAVPLSVPETLKVTLSLPDGTNPVGLGIPEGVTLIVGGGYHGKSTLLRALERGVYPHIPGDGREGVVTDPAAVKIRAEDGRSTSGVDISPFISNLPGGEDTRFFSTPNASGSTSQAANIIEALEMGARVLLIDEDTSATNFMIRDKRMQALVARECEPITPLIDQVRALFEQEGVSTILVMGGSGDYFDEADRVIMMDRFHPRDVTEQAQKIATEFPTGRRKEAKRQLHPRPRVPLADSFDPSKGRRDVKIRGHGTDEIQFGRHTIELDLVEQIVDPSQTRAIGDIIHYAVTRLLKDGMTLSELLDRIEESLADRGLERIGPWLSGEYARPRRFEIGAAINRLRTLRCRKPNNP